MQTKIRRACDVREAGVLLLATAGVGEHYTLMDEEDE